MRDENQRRLDALDDRQEIVDLPAQLSNTLGLISVSAGVPTEIRCPSAGSLDHVLGGEVADRARAVLDDDGLPEDFRHLVGDDAGIGIDGAARRKAYDEFDRARLRQGAGARAQQNARRRSKTG